MLQHATQGCSSKTGSSLPVPSAPKAVRPVSHRQLPQSQQPAVGCLPHGHRRPLGSLQVARSAVAESVVSASNEEDSKLTVIRLNSAQKPGFLALVTQVFKDLDGELLLLPLPPLLRPLFSDIDLP